jgi:hypothetical protein
MDTTVQALQQRFIALGYDLGPSWADGDAGRKTISAVTKFQADRKLDIQYPGTIGPRRWRRSGSMNRLPITCNQSNSVSIVKMPKARVKGLRFPTTYPMPAKSLGFSTFNGKISSTKREGNPMFGNYSKLAAAVIGNAVAILLVWLSTKGIAEGGPGPTPDLDQIAPSLASRPLDHRAVLALVNTAFVYFFPRNKPA